MVSHGHEAILSVDKEQIMFGKAFEYGLDGQKGKFVFLRRMLSDPLHQFDPKVVSIDFNRVMLYQFNTCPLMHIEPPLQFSFLLTQHPQDALLVLGVELPVEDGDVAIVELVGRITHDVLVKHHSSGANRMFLLVVVGSDKLLAEVVGDQVEVPTVRMQDVVK